MKNVPGYFPANRQTPFAVLGCGIAFLAILLFIGVVFSLGAVA